MDSQALETQDSVDMNTSISQTTNKGAQVVFVSLKKTIYVDPTDSVFSKERQYIAIRKACFKFCVPVSEMTYTVSSGTLNSTIPYH